MEGRSEGSPGRDNGMCEGPEARLPGCTRTCWTKRETREIKVEGEGKLFLSLSFLIWKLGYQSRPHTHS